MTLDRAETLQAELASEGARIANDAAAGMEEWFRWRSQLAVILAMKERWTELRTEDPAVIQTVVAESMRESVAQLRAQCVAILQRLESEDGDFVDVPLAITRQMPQEPEARNAPFDLPVLKVTLSEESGAIAGSGAEARESKIGDYMEVVGEQVHFKPGAAFSMYNLASMLPLLAGAQHAKDPNDWFTQLQHVRSVDPSCGSKFVFDRLGSITFKLDEVENVAVQQGVNKPNE